MIFSSLQDNSHIFTIFFNSFDGLQFYTDCAFSNNWASLSSSFLSFLPRLFVINWLEGPNLDGTHQTDGSISKNQAWSIWVKDVASVKKIASCDWKNSKVWPPFIWRDANWKRKFWHCKSSLCKNYRKAKKQPGHLKINYTLKHYGKFLWTIL